MTLKTGADRSGNTSRRRSCIQNAPIVGAGARRAAPSASGALERLANQPANHDASCNASAQWLGSVLIVTASPFSACAFSRNAPSTTICSPARRPDSTSTSPPRSRPRPMRRISKWLRVLRAGTRTTRCARAAPPRPAPSGSARRVVADRQRGAWPTCPGEGRLPRVRHVDPDGHGARFALDLPSDRSSTVPSKSCPGSAGKRRRARSRPARMRTASRSNACTVSHSVDRFADAKGR